MVRGRRSELAMADLLTKMEFAVKMNSESCADVIRSKLVGTQGIRDIFIDACEERVVVDTILKTSEVQALLESTGLLVFFRGFGGSVSALAGQEAAVSILKGERGSTGLVRMVQTGTSCCVVEAMLHKLLPGDHYSLSIHKLGDISLGGLSCGEVYHSLGHIKADTTGTASLHAVSEQVNIADIIGRSVVLTSKDERLMYGVVARSAGVFQNSKKLCTCDGVTIWDEAQRQLSLNDTTS